ncbi:hypothetical protein [Streptomyces sp. NPDC050560]|uniref:hypothetical protein n=1 Tax=Streptomyces sp. NPDC050560 TaxID=3365630 RepID=UPI0037AF6714
MFNATVRTSAPEAPKTDRAHRLRDLQTVAAALEDTPDSRRYRALLAALDEPDGSTR